MAFDRLSYVVLGEISAYSVQNRVGEVYRGEDAWVTHDNLTQCLESFCAHKDRDSVQRRQDDIQDGVEAALQTLGHANVFRNSVKFSQFDLGTTNK